MSPGSQAGAPPEVFLGSSAAMRQVLDQVAVAASSRVNVLISGEPGTGHEMVARAIHARCRQAHAPFMKVDCLKDLSDDVERDLFGIPVSNGGRKVERRAFERITRAARLYQAIGGTLFLEHVIELPGRAQARLARLLRDREAVIQDDGLHVEVNVRAITAAESNFDAAVEDGRIRADLHQRLSPVRIEVPPLRDRKEDIPALAAHFVEDSCRHAHVPGKALSEPAQLLLAALPWHGNALELRHLIEGLVVRVKDSTIGLEDVLANVHLDGRAGRFVAGGTLREARARFEREYIAAVLEQHHGRVAEAAGTLGIQRTNLYRKLRGLRPAEKRGKGSSDGATRQSAQRQSAQNDT